MDDKLITLMQIHQMEVEYWNEVELNGGCNSTDFFVEGGTFAIDDKVMNGKEEIAAFYRWRRSLGPRVTRHLISNMHIAADYENRATFKYVMQLFAGNGEPVLKSEPASLIADVTDECVKVEGRWYIESRKFKSLFAGSTPATVPNRQQIEDNR